MDTFHANIVTILWEEKVQTFRFAVRLYVYIEMFIQKDRQGTVSSGNSETNSGNNHSLAIPSQGGMHSFNRQGACVSRNWRYESETELKPLPLTWYEQFWKNWIIVLMFVESQIVQIQSNSNVCTKILACCSIK